MLKVAARADVSGRQALTWCQAPRMKGECVGYTLLSVGAGEGGSLARPDLFRQGTVPDPTPGCSHADSHM
jgi:hypothetical protein